MQAQFRAVRAPAVLTHVEEPLRRPTWARTRRLGIRRTRARPARRAKEDSATTSANADFLGGIPEQHHGQRIAARAVRSIEDLNPAVIPAPGYVHIDIPRPAVSG